MIYPMKPITKNALLYGDNPEILQENIDVEKIGSMNSLHHRLNEERFKSPSSQIFEETDTAEVTGSVVNIRLQPAGKVLGQFIGVIWLPL